MDARYYLTCCWPGLSELWWRGRLSALPIAVGFGMGLNSLLALTYFYPDWLSPFLVRSAWWVGIAAWIYWTLRSARELPALLAPREVSEQPDRFAEAQTAYLRGEWGAAETLLLGVLSIDPRDPPALLMLSGVYRHSDRANHAAALVDEMRRLEVADGWKVEMDAEEARIMRILEAEQEEGDETQQECAADEGNAASNSDPSENALDDARRNDDAADLAGKRRAA